MKTEHFSERLNLALDKEGFPPKNRGRIQLLAEMVGLSHRGASKWVSGQTSPPAKKFTALAKKLNVSELWLRSGEGPMENLITSLPGTSPSSSFQIPIYESDTLRAYKKTMLKTVSCQLPYAGHFFGIVLDTEAMTPRFPNHSIVIFDTIAAKDGDFVLVDYQGLPSPIFRQLLIVGNVHYLNAHNPKFDRLVLTPESTIMGKLVQAIVSFD